MNMECCEVDAIIIADLIRWKMNITHPEHNYYTKLKNILGKLELIFGDILHKDWEMVELQQQMINDGNK